MCACSVASVMSDSLRPCGLQPARILCPWDSPGKNTGVGCLPSFRGSPNQRLNPGLLHCRQILYQLSHQGSQKRCYKPTHQSVQTFQPRTKDPAVRTGMGCYLHMCTWRQKACPSGTNCLSTGRRRTPDPPFLLSPSPRGG